MNLFQLGEFELASGRKSNFKIECDALTDEDWDSIAAMLSPLLEPFDVVYGVPTGGAKLESAMTRYRRSERHVSQREVVLLVDDVYTTGQSMERYRDILIAKHPNAKFIGAVVFARGWTPAWLEALFTINTLAMASHDKTTRRIRVDSSKDASKYFSPQKKTLLSRVKDFFVAP